MFFLFLYSLALLEVILLNDKKKGWDFFFNSASLTVLLKYGRPVAKYDPSFHRATQGPTIDGPFGYQWII